MTEEELKARLSDEHVRTDAYDVDGDPSANECYVLRPDSSGWIVGYLERGIVRRLCQCATPEEARAQLYDRLIKDPSTRV